VQDTVYSDEQLTRYLLGELPEGERARIEERYLQDAEFFERLEAVESELIEEYVQGELTGDDRGQFEKRFLITPHGRRKVEVYRAVNSTILEEPPDDATPYAARDPTPARQSFLSRLLPRKAAWGFAYAAAALVFLGAVWAVVDNMRLRAELEGAWAGVRQKEQELRREAAERQRLQEQQEAERRTHSAQLSEAQERERAERERGERLARQLSDETRRERGSRDRRGREPALPPHEPLEVASAYVFPFNPVRSAVRLETPLVIRPGQRTVPLKIDLGGRDYPAYRVSLQTVEGREVWGGTVRKGQPNLKDSAIFLSPPANIFTRKDYTLSVFPAGHGEAESLADYSFGVEKRDRD
jgi:hypothetical protein